jgi:S1-C subfamily serine protease
MGMGTGFIISLKERLILTASHVIEGNSNIQFVMERGNTQVNARLLWNNPTIDMALLECDAIPTDSRYFKIDTDLNANPKVLERILHCGFLKGTDVSTNFSTCEGAINNYDPNKQLADRLFDAILSDIQATNGCSGGPIMRASDYIVIGVLQGGFNNAPARVITDIHQLYKQKTLIIKNER